ncbi:MAG: ABC transporter ATP-binding protein [Betaproteobacteria bacterium]|nr:ABC transporter ATP-binding protein [Betaproteobacteria bacterium]
MRDANRPAAGVPAAPLLAAERVGKSFGALQVLEDVSLSIGRGEAVGIVGPNGAGKTTLFNVLSGAYPPSQGSVRFDGRDVTALDAAARCRLGVARSHQVPRPFGGMTVFENLHVAASVGAGASAQRARELCLNSLQLCGMLGVANRRADTLGLLDRKRLEMARALATDPQILLLDEIGGGLTDAEALELVDIIRQIRASGVTIVWIEHIVHVLLQVVQRLVCMESGRIIADGDPHTVMRDPAVIEAYLGSVSL